MKYEIDGRGRLTISLEGDGDREDLQEKLDRTTNRDSGFLTDLLEDWSANGHLYPVAPEWIGALTDAPIITDDLTIEDDGKAVVNGRVWWFPGYETESFAQTLIEKGSVTFAPAPENADQHVLVGVEALKEKYLEAAGNLRTKQAALESDGDALHAFVAVRDELIAHPDFDGLPETYYTGGSLDPFRCESNEGDSPSP